MELAGLPSANQQLQGLPLTTLCAQAIGANGDREQVAHAFGFITSMDTTDHHEPHLDHSSPVIRSGPLSMDIGRPWPELSLCFVCSALVIVLSSKDSNGLTSPGEQLPLFQLVGTGLSAPEKNFKPYFNF